MVQTAGQRLTDLVGDAGAKPWATRAANGASPRTPKKASNGKNGLTTSAGTEPSYVSLLQAVVHALEELRKSIDAQGDAARADTKKIVRELGRLNQGVDANAKLQLMFKAGSDELFNSERSALLDAMLARIGRFRSASDAIRLLAFLDKYRGHVRTVSELIYERLPHKEQAPFVRWVLARRAGINTLEDKERKEYDAILKRADKLKSCDSVEIEGRTYEVKDLTPIGYDLRMIVPGARMLVHGFILKEYRHPTVHVRSGDVIIDAGAYIGDTAVAFAHAAEFNCRIHSFELSRTNLAVFAKQLELIPQCAPLVTMNRLALGAVSDKPMGYSGEGSVRAGLRAQANTGSEQVMSIALDDYVERQGLERVDFIKMDIEGGEQDALKGAVQTIKRFKPRLAICLYHLWDDIYEIPRLVLEANPNYRLGFHWVNKETMAEAVLFAIDES